LSKFNKNQILAKRLALWSISDQIDHKKLDNEVLSISKKCADVYSDLKEIEEKINKLNKKKKEIAKKIIVECFENIQQLQKEVKDEMAKPLVDLAFWNCMSNLNPELYKAICPCLNEMEDKEG
jgi:predicted  nucleic acid-binding Zn-ribbon protein